MSKAALLTGPSRALVITYNGPKAIFDRASYLLFSIYFENKNVPIKLQHLSIFLQF